MKKLSKNNIEAIKFYVDHKDVYSKTAVGEMFGCDRHIISQYENSYTNFNVTSDLYPGYFISFSKKEMDAITEYSTTNVSKKYIMEKYGIGNTETIDRWLSVLGLSKERHYKYNYKRDDFSSVNSEEQAYWIGFLVADGYVYKTRTLSLKLADRDKDHIEKFADFLCVPQDKREEIIKPDCSGYTKDSCSWCIDICCEQICKDLKPFGVFQCKSTKEKPYFFSDDLLEKAYVRGLIDGDGWVSAPQTKQKQVGFCGSFEMCEYIRSVFEKVSGQAPKISQHGKIYHLKAGNKDAVIKILRYLYDDSKVFLTRKYNNAVAVIKSLDEAGTLNYINSMGIRTEGYC